MADEECDLETLTAFLEESDEDEDVEGSSMQKKETPASAAGDESNLEELTAFFEASEDEEERAGVDELAVALDQDVSEKKSAVANKDQASSQSMEEELTRMKERMKFLEEQLIKQTHSQTPPTKQASTSKFQELDENPFFNENNVKLKPEASKESTKTITKPGNILSSGTAVNRKKSNELEKSLFGDSDGDSDWDELDGESRKELSLEGKELHNMLKKGPQQREAHIPKPMSSPFPANPTPLTTWKTKSPDQTAASKLSAANSIADPFSGIRIINPKISSFDLKMKMMDRKMIKLSRLSSKVNTTDLQSNWVTIGVIIHKTEPRQSSSGKTFCIWKLTDLQDCDKVVSFFLFGNVYKQHWKNDAGTVIGLLNPSLMDSVEKKQSGLAFTISHPQQLLLLGHSSDMGKCAGKTKAGNSCTNVINRQQGEYCSYHVQAVYKKSASKRSELQTSYTGSAPKAFEKQQRLLKGNSFFFYGGETFTNSKSSSHKKKKDDVTVKKLQQQLSQKGKEKVTTMSIHELDPEDKAKLKNLSEEKNQEFLEMLSTPSVGSMNLVKHLIKKEKKQKGPVEISIQSVTAKELLKQHKQEMRERQRLQKLDASQARDPLQQVPTLGKGFYPGAHISLDSIPSRQPTPGTDVKKLAIAKIKAKGGLEKDDPNAVKKKHASPETKERVKKRLAESMDNSTNLEDEQPKKKSKLLGNLDLNSAEVQRLMKMKSKHQGAVAEVEAEQQERYFSELEKKEKYEEKMASITELKCKVYTCKQCNYTAFSLSEKCKTEGHDTKRHDGTKRFFKCKKCKHRTVSLQKYPSKPCRECGEHSYERTSMLKEKSGPKLESEELCLRGNEINFVGGMNQKVYLNVT